jgi:hypothetical protein
MNTKEALVVSLVLKDLGIQLPKEELARRVVMASLIIESLQKGDDTELKRELHLCEQFQHDDQDLS